MLSITFQSNIILKITSTSDLVSKENTEKQKFLFKHMSCTLVVRLSSIL